MRDTLSVTQWQRLQDLFEQADELDVAAIDALLHLARGEDARVADALAAMLDAHQRWRLRTADAVQHLAQSTQVSAVGARLGAYSLVSEIGRGGMGVVYLGQRVDGQVQQQVAIKVLHIHHLDDNTRARFQREREILAGFEHPGIARLLDAGESAAGEPYFVMEYLRGLSVTAHCDAQRLGIRARLQLFLDVCAAVQYAHGKLILHRDIKPSNVLVDSTGIPRLIDFGIAKPLHDANSGRLDETALAQRFFSPVNAAPEQVRGDPAAVTCDVYQLGTLLYELLCGQPLFALRGKTATQIEELICELPPRLPSDNAASGDAAAATARHLANNAALQRALRGDLDAITMRAVRKEPASRYASVEQLADDVRRHLNNLPVHGRRGTTWYRLQRFVQRLWQSLAVASIGVLGLILFTTLLIRQQQATALERDNAIAERNRGEAVTEFLVDIFRVAESSPTAGPATPIGEALRKGEELLDQRTAMDPRARARLLGILVSIHLNLSNLDAAEVLIRKAVQLLESTPGVDPLLLADHYQQASGIFYMRDNVEHYRLMATKAVAIYDRLAAPLARSWPARLNVLRAIEETDKAAGCAGIERLLANLRSESEINLEGLGGVVKEISHCRLDTQEGLARNETDLRDTIHILAGKFGKRNFMVLQLKQRLASVLLREQRLDEAAAVLQELLAEQIPIYGEQSWSVALTLQGLGEIAYAAGHYAVADQTLIRARAMFLVVHKGKANYDIALVAYSLGRVQEFGYHDSAKARELYATAVDVARTALGPHSADAITYGANYGALLLRLGDAIKAEPLLVDAVGLLPGSDRNGARARIALASIHAARNELPKAQELLDAASEGIAAALREDPTLASDIQHLRNRLK
ncbi:MAG: serine/threonine-protein kinase [Dokdonella sp.]